MAAKTHHNQESVLQTSTSLLTIVCGALASILMMVSCTSTSHVEKQAPSITAKTSTLEAIALVREHGPLVLKDAKQLIQARNDWPKVRENLRREIPRVAARVEEPRELINLLHLYQESTDELDLSMAETLITSTKPLSRLLGWQLIANYPGPKTAQAIERMLTQILIRGEERDHLVPPLANAVAINRLTTAYTVMRQGLMQTGDDTFAKAMIALNPKQASDDFLDYLALAPVEELRQLNQTSVNMYACLVILRHLVSSPPAVNHPQTGYLFMYSVSRNKALAEIAQLVLDRNFHQEREQLALVLTNMPTWIQMAFIENSRRNLSANSSLFLSEMSRLAVQPEVLDELNSVSR